MIGPYDRNRVVLCSADASPNSQRNGQDDAAHFFPGAPWVGAIRNSAERLGCRFVILTTGHGMVNPHDVIQPFDMHIDEYREQVQSKWLETIPQCLGHNRCDILVFYSGGCPREAYLDLMTPILERNNVSLITFGRPNMYDIDNMEELVETLITGTTFDDLKSILRLPERLEYFPAGQGDIQPEKTAHSTANNLKGGSEIRTAFKILFNARGNPHKMGIIRKCITAFGESYNVTIREVINNSEDGLNRAVFFENVGRLMPIFKMTRAGPFKGVGFIHGTVKDPKGQISACWDAVGERTVGLREFVDEKRKRSRVRTLVEMSQAGREEVALELWQLLNKLSPVCWSESSFGLVGASKVLFAVLPEVALPVDNAEWRKVFRTIDYGDIILRMADEISVWEKQTGARLDECDSEGKLTLPAVYNVVAMKARPKSKAKTNAKIEMGSDLLF